MTVKNLNIKDPYIQGGAYGAAVLIDTAGEINDYSDVRDGTYLDLENIRVYGDDIKLQGWGVGGIAVNVGVQKVTIKMFMYMEKCIDRWCLNGIKLWSRWSCRKNKGEGIRGYKLFIFRLSQWKTFSAWSRRLDR